MFAQGGSSSKTRIRLDTDHTRGQRAAQVAGGRSGSTRRRRRCVMRRTTLNDEAIETTDLDAHEVLPSADGA